MSKVGRGRCAALVVVALVAAVVPVLGVGPVGAATGFSDVGDDHPFASQIQWMIDEGVTNGYADGTFKPTAPITRQAMAAFLHRVAGEPTAPPLPPVFSDVTAAHPFAGPIAWMIDEGITNGYPDGTFRPTAPITRQAMAAFLFRAAGEPAGPFAPIDFSDVAPGSPFAEAIAWMVDAGITTGYPDGTFKPGAPVTRQAMAAFLHRAVANPAAWDTDAITIGVDPPNPGDVVDCADFADWAAATRWHDWFAVHGDPAALDPDGAGPQPLCPDLPGAPTDEEPPGELSDDLDAPPVDDGAPYSTGRAAAFLHEGPSAVQTGVTPGTIDPVDPSILRGRVLDTDGQPLAGVTVTIDDHPEYGQTLTRDNGRWDLATNPSGTPLLLRFTKDGFLPVQRRLGALPGEYTVGDDVVLTALDPVVTDVAMGTDTMQVAASSEVTDADGTRRNTTLIPAGTTAELVLPDDTRQPAPTLSLRATEYTVGDNGPEAMPGQLPGTSAYTYAVEISADQALAEGASVEFDQPVVNYVEDFLGFPAGTPVPAGWYDTETDRWNPAPNGLVITIVTEGSGLAQVDITGDDVADTGTALTAIGITDAERIRLATLYDAGQTLWRVPLTHLTPWDYNWPYGCESACAPPRSPKDGGPGEPETAAPNPGPGGCDESGSIIRCYEQALGDSLALAGTPYELRYDSTSMPGALELRQVDIPITGSAVPPGLGRIEATVTVAGQRHVQTFPPQADQRWDFTWDGNDAYGNAVSGPVEAELTLDYVYPAVYKSPAAFAAAFAAPATSNPPTPRKARQEISNVRRSRWTLVGTKAAVAPAWSIGGWTLDALHRYSPQTGELALGDGRTVQTGDALGDAGARVAGNGEYCWDNVCGEGQPAHTVPMSDIRDVALDAQGRLLVLERYALRRVDPQAGGTVTTLAGTTSLCNTSLLDPACGVGGPATAARLREPRAVAVAPDGAIHILEQANMGGSVIRTIGTDGILRHTAGTGNECSTFVDPGCGEGGPATAAPLRSWQMAVGVDGTIYLTEHGQVRTIEPDGIVRRIAGCRSDQSCISTSLNTSPTDLLLNTPNDVAVAPDGSVVFSGTTAWVPGKFVFRITPDGTLSVIAGLATCDQPTPTTTCGVGGPALTAGLGSIGGLAIAPDGRIHLVTDLGVLAFAPGGTLEPVAGNGGTCEMALCAQGISPQASPLPAPVIELLVSPDDALFIASDDGVLVYGRPDESVPPGAIPAGVVHTVPDPDGVHVHLFDGQGRHLATQDLLTRAVVRTFTYDAEGRLTAIVDVHGNTTTFARDVAGRVTTVTGPFGHVTALTYDANGLLGGVSGPAGPVTLVHDDGGLLTQRVDPGGATHTFGWDAVGRLVSDTGPDGMTQTLSRSGTADDLTVTVASPGGATAYRLQRSGDGVVTRTVTDPRGGVASSVHDPTAGTSVLTEPDGTVTTTSWGADPTFGDAAKEAETVVETLPGGTTRTTTQTRQVTASPFTPLAIDAVVETTTVEGRTTTRAWDRATRTTTQTSPEGRTSTVVVDAKGQVISSTPGAGMTPVTTTWDSRGFPTSVTAGGRTTTLVFDAAGRLTSRSDDSGDATTYAYDAADRPTSMTMPTGRVVAYARDVRGNITSVDLPGPGTASLGWSAGDQLTSFTAPGLAAEAHGYDADRRRATTTLPSGQVLSITRDPQGRVVTEATAQASATSTYVGATDRPATTTWTPTGGTGSTLATTWDGSLTTGVDATGASTWSADWTWSPERWLTGITVTSGVDTVTVPVARDGDGLVTGVGPFTVANAGPGGTMSSVTDGTATTDVGRNAFAEPTDRHLRVTGATRYRQQLVRDDEGRITGSTETLPSGATRTTTYTYDADGRLTGATIDGVTTAYAYDADGNPTTGPSGAATFDVGGRATVVGGVARTWDANGRLASRGADTFTYLATGELRSATVGGQAVTYTYDGLGRRTSRTAGGSTTQYLYADPGNPLRLTGWRAPDGVLSTVWRDGDGRPVAVTRPGSTWYLGTDHVGTVTTVTDTTGTVIAERTYDPWGRQVADTAPSLVLPLGFADGLADPLTGLVRFGARDYDPASGTWTATDPARFAGGANLYAYVGADPVNRTDPTGRWCVGGSAYAGIGAGVEYCRDQDGNQSICMEVGVGIGAGVSVSSAAPADTGWGLAIEASAGCGPIGVSAGISVTRNECPDGNPGELQWQNSAKSAYKAVNAAVADTDFDTGNPGTFSLEHAGGARETRPGCNVAGKAVGKRCVRL